jgi:hypothetical protein
VKQLFDVVSEGFRLVVECIECPFDRRVLDSYADVWLGGLVAAGGSTGSMVLADDGWDATTS